ncbi:ABC transporter ATP-binding protein [Xylocopilactobacillus apicola]|uniref:Peptide ABC transporter ATP-binding protein n=1 Tax=Xylocopilactobacillus apicola TaxID=2932184 RepID=A0AAU9CYM1_9LACO|nr:ABC transporter ATP-binding protein [Xylocopilactobacillus apicola]BDR59114.1 peptide ABC transporter ATP-binding protein [Xylocopilactobacillus apicola]
MTIILKAQNINKKYGRTPILNGISLNVEEGQFIAIMGNSGAGKSTLLNCISGMDQPDSGKILLLDNELSRMSNRDLASFRAKNMGFIFQDFRLLEDMSLLDNLLVRGYLKQSKSDALKQANDLLDKVQLLNVKNHYPSQLSGGQKQRGAIARALMNNPEIVFADEPTGALNSAAGKQVMETLKFVNVELKTTVLMVTHDVRSASYCDQIIYLSDGKILGNLTLDYSKNISDINAFLSQKGW